MAAINRAQVALLLHITPAEVDEMPMADQQLVLDIHEANQEIIAWRIKHRRGD